MEDQTIQPQSEKWEFFDEEKIQQNIQNFFVTFFMILFYLPSFIFHCLVLLQFLGINMTPFIVIYSIIVISNYLYQMFFGLNLVVAILSFLPFIVISFFTFVFLWLQLIFLKRWWILLFSLRLLFTSLLTTNQEILQLYLMGLLTWR